MRFKQEALKKNIEFKNCIKYIIEFHNSILKHNRVLIKLKDSQHYTLDEIFLIQESVLIKQITAWEVFVYNMIIHCISIDTTRLSEYIGVELPKSIEFDNAQAIFNGVSFTSFSNTSQINDLAENLITKDNNPFQQFLPPMLKYIDEAYLLRNYIAHKSHVSKSKIVKMYKTNYSISDYIRPGKFLNEFRDFGIGKSQTFELYYFVLMQIAVFTWRFLDRGSYDKVFKKNNEKEITGIGYFNMTDVFENLTEKFNL